jgi:hypothetical protein
MFWRYIPSLKFSVSNCKVQTVQEFYRIVLLHHFLHLIPAVQKWGSWKGAWKGKKWHHYSRWQSQRGSQMGNNMNITNENIIFFVHNIFLNY